MKTRRLFLILSIMLLLVMFFSLSSSLFALKEVQVCFYNSLGESVSLSSNLFYTSQEKVADILSSTSFDYGNLVFSLQKEKYRTSLESHNPYLKTLSLESVFPNKLILNVCERKQTFCMQNNSSFYILDGEFKVLDTQSAPQNLPQINFFNNKTKVDFCEFFDLYFLDLEVGTFLCENNNVFSSINNFYSILTSYPLPLDTALLSLDFFKGEQNRVDLSMSTAYPLGINLQLENIFERFDYKLSKLLSALCSLREEEPIKTTYGLLKIDHNCNIFFKSENT